MYTCISYLCTLYMNRNFFVFICSPLLMLHYTRKWSVIISLFACGHMRYCLHTAGCYLGNPANPDLWVWVANITRHSWRLWILNPKHPVWRDHWHTCYLLPRRWPPKMPHLPGLQELNCLMTSVTYRWCTGYVKDAQQPHNLCIQHKEWHTFTLSGSRFGNVPAFLLYGHHPCHCQLSFLRIYMPSWTTSTRNGSTCSSAFIFHILQCMSVIASCMCLVS